MTETMKQVFTRIPRWTAPSGGVRGTGSHRTRVPVELTTALDRVAAELGQADAVLLAAVHARVLATVTAERDLLCGLIPPMPGRGEALLRVMVGRSTWASLVEETAEAVNAAHGENSGAESVLDLSGLGDLGSSSSGPREGEVLRVAWERDDEGLALRILFDQSALDASYAERLAGYHQTALRLLMSDPGARHDRQSLLTSAERDTLLHGLAGPRVELPDLTFVELYQEQVRTTPEAVAVEHHGHRWTYRQLDEHANRVAHALLRAGLGTEGVVAVVMDRTPDWIAAALGVFKAGGVYLPVRPGFPAGRVAAQFGRSGCAFALVEPGSADLVERASAAVAMPPTVLSIPDVHASDCPVEPPATVLSPEQGAYIYFTSGSTGTPKGALCEHAGMLNHLYMKIEDLGVGPGTVVAQTASQCFDISLWQFAAPLVAGGRVRIVGTEVQLDVSGFIDTIVDSGVAVAQVVPSYLEVLLTYLEQHPRELGMLRMLSVTGEALMYDLVVRWFAAYPGIRLANAYGATEVSDDTMHEILDGVPQREFVSVGRSLRNVNTYVLDDNLEPAPLGTVGEIAFSGVCVGRGYINDEERTREAFLPDPFRPGTRMYRTGDYGRWLPEGHLEFRGRRDEQVKINGFRIEIGEIENKLLAVEQVRQAAVVVDGEVRTLVAFYSTDGALSRQDARNHLAEVLPDYLMPTYFHQLERLPLTENGKVDKKALSRLAGTLGHGDAPHVGPSTASERQLAPLWAEVLGVPLERIGSADDFFGLGGTSLAAVRLLVQLNRALSLKDLLANPVLADLARVLDERGRGGPQSAAGRLLQPLAPVVAPHRTLVCFPYAGGNALNFRSLATNLAGRGIAVLGVEPPGHDFAHDGEPPQDVRTLARRVCEEIAEHVSTPVLLWGHCAGAVTALETARLLEARGTPAERVFVAALLFDEPPALREEIAEVYEADASRLLDRLRADNAYVELDTLKPERAEVVGHAYRHDVLTSDQQLLRIHENPALHRLTTPVDVVVARDDPSTAGFETAYRRWETIAGTVRLHELAQGGHYFAGTRPAEVADLVRAAGARQGQRA